MTELINVTQPLINYKQKWKLAFAMFFLLIFIQLSVFGQEDVTTLYLTNAGFNSNCNYLIAGSETVSTTDPGNTHVVSGWAIESSPAWSAGATFEYGWGGAFNSVSAPSSGADGSSGTGNGALGLTAGWGGAISYTQEVTLPIGRYSIIYAVLFKEYDNISSSLMGWVPEVGSSVLSDLTTVLSVDTWYIDTVTFTITQETKGDIQVGMKAYPTSGSTSNARIFIDYVKIYSLAADKTELQALVDSANVMQANPESIPDGSTAYIDLENVTVYAQSILDDIDATVDTIIKAQNELETAIDAVYAAIFSYQLESATFDNPIDVTVKIVNPDFEMNGGSTDGWTTTLGIYKGANSVFDGAPVPNHVMDGDPDASSNGHQIVTGIPSGVYKVKAVARGRTESAAQMFIGAEPGKIFGSEYRSSTEVDRIGDTGGELNFGFNQYETPFVVLPDTIFSITLGIYFNGDCGWSSVDNFEMYYYGQAADVVAKLKENLIALRDSVDIPSGYDVSDIDSLVAVTLTPENTSSLITGLENAVQTLQLVISDNIDATLSDLKVAGKTIRDFSPSVYFYNYYIYSSTPQTPDIPNITATQNSKYAAAPVMDNADLVPDTTFITVTAGNGDQLTYAVRIAFVLLDKKENYTATFDTYQDQNVELSGVGQLTVTGSENPLNGSAINLVSTDTWIYFPNIRPSTVVKKHLAHIFVNGEEATFGENIRVSQYLNGAMVIPHSATYQALTVYEGEKLTGTARSLGVNQYYKTSGLGEMNNNIESFKLKRGYMATFASNENGTGVSRVYVADQNDITVNTMPEGLSNTVSFVIIREWRWTIKKGVVGGSADADIFGAGTFYNYNNDINSSLDQEYIPMRHNSGWAAYPNFLDRLNSNHALFYNEPSNAADGEVLTVDQAIEAYPNMMASGLRLGSPANTDGNLSWLYRFVDQCDALGYRLDFVAWHFYRAGYTAEGLYNTLKAVHERTGRPLWITEWNNGCNWTYNGNVPTIEENGEVIKAFTAMMDTASFIERYFVWNGCNEELRMTNSATGELYPAGIAYRDQVSTISFTDDYYNSNESKGSIIQENSAGLCKIEGSIENTYRGFTGIGYINANNEVGTGVDWNINFTSEGAKTVTFRYADTNDHKADLIINDSVVATDILLGSTGTLINWYELPVTIYLDAGIKKIRLEAKDDGGLPNIDYIQVTDATSIDCNVLNDTNAIILQENITGFCGVDGVIDTEYDGYTGDGIANTDDAFGRGINYRVYFTKSGDKNLRIRYASAEDRTANLVIDGAIIVSDFLLPSTGSLEDFDTISIPFITDKDTVTLRIEATSGIGLANVDYIQLTHAVGVNCIDYENEELVLRHSYTFEDGTANDIVGDAHGVIQGGTIINGTYLATQKGEYISLPATSIAINTFSSITLEAYIDGGSSENTGNTKLSFFGGSSGENGINYLYTSLDSRGAISCNNSSTPNETETGIDGVNLNDGKKHHLVLVVSEHKLFWYVDGKLINSTTLYSQHSIRNLSNDLAYIGKSGFSGESTWLGSIGEFNIYEGIMNPDSIAKHAARYTLEVRHSYTFDDGTADDSVGDANGTLHGGEIKLGSYRAFSKGNYIELPADLIAINTYKNITIEALVKADNGVNGSNTMMSYFGETTGSYGANYLFTSLKSRAAISCNNSSNPWSSESGVSGDAIDDGGYYHLVTVLTDNTITFYINGVLVGSTQTSSDNIIANLSNSLAYLCKSGYTGDPTWLGFIYEYNIYEGIMFSDRVKEQYNKLINASYTLSYTVNDENNGRILGTKEQTVKLGFNGSAVTANASSDCYFDGWSDGMKEAQRTELYVGMDYNVMANFVKEIILHNVQLTVTSGNDPIEGAIITFDTTNYVSDAEGIVTILEVDDGKYPVVVTANGFNEYKDTIHVEQADVNHTISLIPNVGIKNTLNRSIRVYPNPASSVLYIKSEMNFENILVYDTYGKVVFRKEKKDTCVKNIKLDTHDWGKGVYLIHLQAGDSVYIQKVIVE